MPKIRCPADRIGILGTAAEMRRFHWHRRYTRNKGIPFCRLFGCSRCRVCHDAPKHFCLFRFTYPIWVVGVLPFWKSIITFSLYFVYLIYPIAK